jgi:hypothetical protein
MPTVLCITTTLFVLRRRRPAPDVKSTDKSRLLTNTTDNSHISLPRPSHALTQEVRAHLAIIQIVYKPVQRAYLFLDLELAAATQPDNNSTHDPCRSARAIVT